MGGWVVFGLLLLCAVGAYMLWYSISAPAGSSAPDSDELREQKEAQKNAPVEACGFCGRGGFRVTMESPNLKTLRRYYGYYVCPKCRPRALARMS